MAFIKNKKHEKNGLNSATIMDSEEAYKKYFENEKNLENKLALGRDKCKEYLRRFFNENLGKIANSGVNVIYLTDEGLQFIEPVATPLEVTKEYVNSVLMADPLKKRGPSGGSNTSGLTGKTIYGVQIFWMKSPKVAVQKKKEPEKKYKTPAFKPVIW